MQPLLQKFVVVALPKIEVEVLHLEDVVEVSHPEDAMVALHLEEISLQGEVVEAIKTTQTEVTSILQCSKILGPNL